MNKTLSLLLLGTVVGVNGFAQLSHGVTHSGLSTQQTPFPINQYVELQNPIAVNKTAWNKSQKLLIG